MSVLFRVDSQTDKKGSILNCAICAWSKSTSLGDENNPSPQV